MKSRLIILSLVLYFAAIGHYDDILHPTIMLISAIVFWFSFGNVIQYFRDCKMDKEIEEAEAHEMQEMIRREYARLESRRIAKELFDANYN